MSRKEFRTLADPEDAHAAIASLDLEPASETVPLDEARGRILSERVDAELDVPGFDRASMDGYAVQARDTFGADEANPATLELVGEVHAGEEPAVEVGEGEAAEISTGAVVPPGADAVVMVERTDERDGNVEIRTAVAPGDSVMFAGADIAAGERALGPGTKLTPREIGLLSALGIEEVPVRGQPTVGIVSTGDELVRPGGDLNSDAGQIYDVNSYTTASAIEEAGGEPIFYPHAGDDYEELEAILTEAADECDLVLSSGSTSASAVDVIYEVIEERGELLLHGVSVKPGKPMLVGRLAAPSEETSDEPHESRADSWNSAYIGLPGYPVSALTIFQTFVAPAIRRAAGLPEPRTADVEGKMAARERYAEGRRRLMPVGLVESGPTSSARSGGGTAADGSGDGETLVYPVDKGSGATTSLVEADGIVTVPADTEYLEAGETVEVRLFSPEVRPPTAFGVGEDDPALSRVLDAVRRPRFLGIGSRDGLRRLREGVPDFAVTAGPVEPDTDHPELGGWEREWGLVVAPDSDIEDLAALVDGGYQFVNRTTASGLRASFDSKLDALAATRGEDVLDLRDSIRGYELTVRAHESPARKVARGKADAGLGLHATAEKLGLGFVSLGSERVRVYANEERTEKEGVEALRDAIADVEEIVETLPGYEL